MRFVTDSELSGLDLKAACRLMNLTVPMGETLIGLVDHGPRQIPTRGPIWQQLMALTHPDRRVAETDSTGQVEATDRGIALAERLRACRMRWSSGGCWPNIDPGPNWTHGR